MNQSDERDMLSQAEASIHKAKGNITKSEESYIVEVYKAFGFIKAVVDSIKEKHQVQPSVDPKQ